MSRVCTAARALACSVALVCWGAVAATPAAGEPAPGPGAAPAGGLTAAPAPADPLKAGPEDLEWWRAARFGMFVHWGPVSLKGTEISWSRKEVGIEVYDNLYKQFNPVKFDAREWVAVAQAAGMKYLVFTTKHHDGFCMFDTKLTDYRLTNSPFKRDATAELAKACHDAGIRLGLYYSPTDWHHPDAEKNRARYIQYMHGQLRELCSNYGQVDVIWFDLGGDWDSRNLFKTIRGLQPHVLINDRCGLPGDFTTPEQKIGGFDTSRPWESCITICGQWSWRPNDGLKPLKTCIDTLVRCAGGDGNLLLNVGPTPEGQIEPRQVERLKEMGAWLKKYGASIYGTRGGPFRPGVWGASTCRGETVYLHILRKECNTVVLAPLPRKVVASSVLTGGTATVKQTERLIEVSVPPESRQELDTIVELRLDGPAFGALPGKLASPSLAAGRKATASNTYRQQDKEYGPGRALDDDFETRWATDEGTGQAWLEVDLEKPAQVGRAAISEYERRVQEFELEYLDGGTWRPAARGTTIGTDLELKFAPVTAQRWRLNIRKAGQGPSIWEFQLLPP